MTRYDEIADQYKQAKVLDFYLVVSYSMQRLLGDIKGHSVLDLACGEGFSTRALKQMGSARTVGVDISAQMIRLAREAEEKEPLGIEYVVSSAQELGKLDSFDTVSATFLLNYAPSRDDLYKMFRTAYLNLRPGHRFVSYTDLFDSDVSFDDYGFRYGPYEKPLRDGTAREITVLSGAREITFTSYHFSPQTYESAIREAGFRTVEWHRPLLPPAILADERKELWSRFLELTTQRILICHA